jgi:preprotein translocase subunit YajC
MHFLHHLVISQEGAAPPAAGGDMFSTLGLIAVLFIIFWFLLIRPQQKEAKRHQKLLQELQKGDEVITSAGILGRIYAVDDKIVTLDVGAGDRARIKVLKSSVQRKWSESGPVDALEKK